MLTFGQKLKLLLEERNLTQKQLALNLDIPSSTMGGYIQDTSEPDFYTLKKLADYFNVSTDYLLGHNTIRQPEGTDELIRIFKCLTPEQRELFIEQGRAYLRFNSKKAISLKSISTKAES